MPNRQHPRRNNRHAFARHWVVGGCMALMAIGAVARTATAGAHDTPKPGVYGRIDVRGAPPPLIYAAPVLARPSAASAQQPVYLYVPPGQVRRWPLHCAKWQACDRPVYFVRMDDSPSRLGSWKKAQRPQPADSTVLQALYRFTP